MQKITKTHVQALYIQHSTLAFFLADSEVSALFKMSEETNTLLKQMMEQMNKLQEQVNTLQNKQSTTAAATSMETDDVEQEEGGLVEVLEATQAFLGAAFSGMMDNEDRRKRIRRIGVPDCDQIRCPKLDGVMKAVLPTDAKRRMATYHDFSSSGWMP